MTSLSFTDPQRSSLQKKGATLLWFAAIITAAIGVFWVPWHCPSSLPVPGESYAFGFNNKVGILALGAAIFLGIAASYVGGRRTEGYQWLTESPRFFPSWSEAKAEYRILIAACLLWSTWILFWGNYLVDPAWCDSRGFYYGIDLLALGRVPYRDFMYNYGPATLYLPYWLSSLSGGRLGFEQAYPVIQVLFTCGGFFSLFIIQRRLEIPKAQRALALAAFLISWVFFGTGLQGTPLRFVAVPFSLVLLDAVVHFRDRERQPNSFIVAVSAMIAVFYCFAISPEMGIACTFAILFYGSILLICSSLFSGFACCCGAIFAASAVVLILPDYLLSVFAFASGGSNFPVYPNLLNLTVVCITLIIIPALIGPALYNPSEKRAPLAASLGVAGGMLLPAAFGRCDPGHVFSSSLTPIILMFPAAASFGGSWLRRWLFWYFAIFVVALQLSYWSFNYGQYVNAIQMHEFYSKNPALVNDWKTKWEAMKEASPNGKNLHWSKVLPFPDELMKFMEKGPMMLTSGNEGNYWLARFLMLQPNLPPDYFNAYSQGAATPNQIKKRVSDSSAYEFLITPESVFAPLAGPINLDAYSQGVDAFLTKLLLFPVNSQATRPPYFPDTDYSARMMDKFDPVAKFNGYLILQKKKSSTSNLLSPEAPKSHQR